MFRPFLDSLMLGSMFFPFIAIAGSTAQGGVIHFYGQIVEPACDVSTNVKNAQIASVKVQYLDKQKKLAVMNIEYN